MATSDSKSLITGKDGTMAGKSGFLNKEVAQITGLEQQTIAFYTNKGYIRPSVYSGKGKGSNRKYSKQDVFQLLLIRELGSYGIRLERIKAIFSKLAKHFSQSESKLEPKENKYNRIILTIYDLHTEGLTANFSFLPDPVMSYMIGSKEPITKLAENLREFSVDMLSHSSVNIFDVTHLVRKLATI